jgi:hypothetical protein
MKTSRKFYFKAAWLIALPVVFAPQAGAAEENMTSDAATAPVETLKASLPSTVGFEVDHVRVTDAGVACISYHLPRDTGGITRAKAVVEGDEVLRSTSRNSKFERAWNSKCAGKSDK